MNFSILSFSLPVPSYSGAEGWEQSEGVHYLDWPRRYRPLEYAIPRHARFARVIRRLNPEEINGCNKMPPAGRTHALDLCAFC